MNKRIMVAAIAMGIFTLAACPVIAQEEAPAAEAVEAA
jgi:hypothetical protein